MKQQYNLITGKAVCFLLIFGISFGINKGYSQTTEPNNSYASYKYLGYNTSNGSNPLLFKTNKTNRMALNGNKSYLIDEYYDSHNGHLLLGFDGNSMYSGLSIYETGAFSLLHINGKTASNQVQEYGYRPWMETGII